ncbi:sodium:solute symporter [Rhodococcus sp. NPDC057529]|uniref:sodium:solute symporter n=1 Tax=Rhodococcus sp. NPDC057529 TaxID=3346158 RepID=UPI0036720384
MEYAIIALYIGGMLGIGWWAKTRVRNQSDFLVAGRRLGPILYTGTMAAICIGGASTVGGVGLGYEYGISGMWLVFFIGTGLLLLSLVFAGRINRLGIYTVSEMMELRFGSKAASFLSALVMLGYTFMIAVTSTIAYGAVFSVLFDIDRTLATILGGGIVILYSSIGGMWSISLTDFVQFLIKTVGIFGVLLPAVLIKAGGWEGMRAALPESSFSFGTIGGGTITSYFVIYFFGLVIGQDIWQRVFTARSESVAKWSGAAAGTYCLLYSVAGALIGMGARVIMPDIADRDQVFTEIVNNTLPVALAAIVVAGALSAIMSTSSGGLIAAATVARKDIAGPILAAIGKQTNDENDSRAIRHDRIYIIVTGVLVLATASVLNDIVAALTIAYDILVGGLLVPILGALVWKRATGTGALAATIAGTVSTLAVMAYVGDIYANEPIFVGIAVSAAVFVIASLVTRPTDAALLHQWNQRIENTRTPSDAASSTAQTNVTTAQEPVTIHD